MLFRSNSTAANFLPVAQFPTVAHIDLLHHKLIPDPYIDDNEIKCLWVNDADWTYRTTALPQINLLSPGVHADLVFDGLDTVVDVYLNDKHILSSKNMHVQHRVDVTELLRQAKGQSSLELRFKAAPAFSREEKERIGYKGNETDVHFGGPERLFLRKAQYHWVRIPIDSEHTSSLRSAGANIFAGLGLGAGGQHLRSMEANLSGNF